jgi:hypothetical protein
MDKVYAYLIASTWLFLIGWIVLLLVAGIVVFRETGEPTGSLLPQKSISGRKTRSA